MVFFDTNIFVYAVSGAKGDRERHEAALQLIAETDFGLSVQVIQEFMDVTLRKKQLGLTVEEIAEMVNLMAAYPVVETSLGLAHRAFELKSHFDIRYWDAAIIAAAEELGCDILLSEDLNHGQEYGAIRVVNPFRKK
ncbi:MAG: PIN domain-containing protein [Chthoniobacteraceae bacterium]